MDFDPEALSYARKLGFEVFQCSKKDTITVQQIFYYFTRKILGIELENSQD